MTKATKSDSFIIQMDQLKQNNEDEANQNKAWKAISSIVYSLPKAIIYALAIFGALFIGFTAFFGDNQASSRKVLSEPILMPLNVKYLEQEEILIEIDSLSTVRDIISNFTPNPGHLIILYHGVKLDPASPIADSGISAECLVEIVDPLYQYFMSEMGDLSDCHMGTVAVKTANGSIEFLNCSPLTGEKKGVLKMEKVSEMRISFEEFLTALDAFICGNGLVKTPSEMGDPIFCYIVKEIYFRVHNDAKVVFRKFAKQKEYHFMCMIDQFDAQSGTYVEYKKTGFRVDKIEYQRYILKERSI